MPSWSIRTADPAGCLPGLDICYRIGSGLPGCPVPVASCNGKPQLQAEVASLSAAF
jgi:hypothetical protein